MINYHRHTCILHAHNTQLLYSFLDFVCDSLGEPVPEGTFTHSHLSWLAIIPYLLPLSITIHGILHLQFTCLTVFSHNFFARFLWSASWPGTSISYFIHFFTQSLSSFCSTCPYHRTLLCCSTEIMSLSQPFTWNSIL